jgi:hypothetical protein
MTELKRWLDDSPPEAIRQLLLLAREESAPPRVLQKTLLALGTTSATTAVAAASSVGLGAGTKAGMLSILLKWGGTGLIGGVLVAGTFAGVTRYEASNGKRTPTAELRHPVPAANPVPDLPRVPAQEHAPAPSTSPKPGPTTRHSPAPEPTAAPEPATAAEIQLVDSARAALRQRDAAAVLDLLAGYERSFRPPHLEPEVLYLRMQASLLRGDEADARRFARSIVTRYPKSPGVGQAEALLRAPASDR